MTEHTAEDVALTVAFEVGDGWPTPNYCLRIADALDALTPARYGDILRAYAHAEDARFDRYGPVEAVRKGRVTPPAEKVQVGDLVRLVTDAEPYGRVEAVGDDDMAQVRTLHGDQGVYPCWIVNLRVLPPESGRIGP